MQYDSASPFPSQTQSFSSQQTQYAQPQQQLPNMFLANVPLVSPQQVPGQHLNTLTEREFVLNNVPPYTRAFLVDYGLFERGLRASLSQRSVRLYLGTVEVTKLETLVDQLDVAPSRLRDVKWDEVRLAFLEHAKYKSKQQKELEKQQSAAEKGDKQERMDMFCEKMVPLISQAILIRKKSREKADKSAFFFFLRDDNTVEQLFEKSKDMSEADLRHTKGRLQSRRCPHGTSEEDCAINGCNRRGECSFMRYLYSQYSDSGVPLTLPVFGKLLGALFTQSSKEGVQHVPILSDIPSDVVRFRLPLPKSSSLDAWNAILRRMSCPVTFVCWIAKLFTPNDGGRQALYLHGSGKTGNTTIANALVNFLGPEVATSITFRKEDENSFRTLMRSGSLLSVAGDVGESNVFSTDAFKSATGNEIKMGEQKYGEMKNVATYTKVLITSNNPLLISPLQAASYSRVVYIYMDPVSEGEMQDRERISERLEKELPLFILQCRSFWENEIKEKGLTKDGEVPITRSSASMRRRIEYAADRAVRDWMYTHVVADDQPYRQYAGKTFDDVFTIPAMITYEEVRESVAKIMRKEKGEMDFLDRNAVNLMDLIAKRFENSRRCQKPQKFFNDCGKSIEIRDSIRGLRISDDPVCDLDMGGLEVREVSHDYGLYLGECVRMQRTSPYPHQQQQQLPAHDDIWGDLI